MSTHGTYPIWTQSTILEYYQYSTPKKYCTTQTYFTDYYCDNLGMYWNIGCKSGFITTVAFA